MEKIDKHTTDADNLLLQQIIQAIIYLRNITIQHEII